MDEVPALNSSYLKLSNPGERLAQGRPEPSGQGTTAEGDKCGVGEQAGRGR